VLVQQGKVRYIGVSNWAAWQIAGALGVCALKGFQPIRVIQPMYSLVKRQAEVELLSLAQSAGLGGHGLQPAGRRDPANCISG
jgi:aryl-alcohol dehydrogenase-like predicted oxidoreductase